MPADTFSRRSFLRRTTAAGAGGAAFTIVRPELVRGAGAEKLKAGLIGCGGRGTQAASDLLTARPNVEVVAMGDLFEDRIEQSIRTLKEQPEFARVAGRVNVPPELRFRGFDAYRKVLAADIDIALLCATPAYRPAHFEAAVEARKHIFCEKPFGVDPVGVRRFMAAAKKSEELKLTVKSGAQRRSQKPYLDQLKRVRDGKIGEIVACSANWVGVPVLQFLNKNWKGPKGKRDPKWSDMEFQNRNWYSFVWICGDQVVEQHLHNIDVCNWFMGAHPVEVMASGGAAWRPREEMYGNIYDHLHADFTYANGVHMFSHCRQYRNAPVNVGEIIVGTKERVEIDGRRLRNVGTDPYIQEHADMVDSILGVRSLINEAMAVAESTMTCIMAREAAYSGERITWDQIMNSKQDLTPAKLDLDAAVPVPPLPVPGEYKFV